MLQCVLLPYTLVATPWSFGEPMNMTPKGGAVLEGKVGRELPLPGLQGVWVHFLLPTTFTLPLDAVSPAEPLKPGCDPLWRSLGEDLMAQSSPVPWKMATFSLCQRKLVQQKELSKVSVPPGRRKGTAFPSIFS